MKEKLVDEDYTKPLTLLQKFLLGIVLPFVGAFILIRLLFRLVLLAIFRKPSPERENEYAIICLSHVGWHFSWQRNQHVMSRLARKRKVLYLHPLRPDHIIRFPRLINLLTPSTEKNLTIHSPLLLPGQTGSTLLRRINSLVLTTTIKRFARRHNITNIVLWFYYPIWGYVRDALRPFGTVYDIQDEYSQISQTSRQVIESETRLLHEADVTFAGTFALHERKKPLARAIYFFPCGVDYRHFSDLKDTDRPHDMTALTGPVLGYFGSIHNRKISEEILAHLARAHPEWSLVLIGPVHKALFRLPPLPNIHILGKKEYRDLPRYLRYFNVCLMPFVRNELTEHINPTKCLEYFASGRPVVSTPIPDMVKFYSEVILFGETPEKFTRMCERALNEDMTERIEQGRIIAREQSWEHIVKGMEDKLEEALGIYGH